MKNVDFTPGTLEFWINASYFFLNFFYIYIYYFIYIYLYIIYILYIYFLFSYIKKKFRRKKKTNQVQQQKNTTKELKPASDSVEPSTFQLNASLLVFFLLTAITCGHPGNPAHGMTNGSEFNLNDVVNFTCNTGYLLQGASRAQCRSNGQWSSPLPSCRGKKPHIFSAL